MRCMVQQRVTGGIDAAEDARYGCFPAEATLGRIDRSSRLRQNE